MAANAKTPEAILSSYEKSSIRPKAMPPLERMIFSVLCDEEHNPVDVEKAISRIKKNFLDWNETRASRWVEVAKILDPLPDADKCAMRLRELLNRIFELRGALDLDFFADMKINEAKRTMQNLEPNMPRSEIAIILFSLIPGCTIPISPEGVSAAKKQGLIGRSGNKSQIQKAIQNSSLDLEQAGALLHYLELEGSSKGTKSTSTKKTAKQ